MAVDLPLKLLLITFAGNVYRDQSRLISYLLEENRIFRELQGKKRPRLSDDQRRRLAAKGKPVLSINTADAILGRIGELRFVDDQSELANSRQNVLGSVSG
tara:strand:+ start:598 stop:900 length:303 start_codon:yes stop_codon:yes gene_type:complete